ncbi:MAG: arginine repressor [Clostridia bacterium]|jgi:transcriptional regulator of arginine metabolism|nr:arginine repressor [Clostridia bacterium]
MKNLRQDKIVSLITNYEIETQEELIGMLRKEGFQVTQATVSRDIRELKLTKVLTGRGSYRYTVPAKNDGVQAIKFNRALVSSIIGVDFAVNNIVIKTYPGLATAVATGLDSIDSKEILGCVAGDDTIIMITRTENGAKDISTRIHALLDSI